MWRATRCNAFPRLGDRLETIPPGINFDRFDPAVVRADRRDPAGRRAARARRQPSHPLPGALRRGSRPEDPDRGGEAARPRRRVLPAAGLVGRAHAVREGTRTRRSRRPSCMAAMQIGPYVDDMPAAYMLADVVVATGGARQGFSRALVEAQAMGRPVVAEDGGGAAETVRAGVTGWLAPAGDAGGAGRGAAKRAVALGRAPRRTGARGAGAGAQPLRSGTIQPPVARNSTNGCPGDESAASRCPSSQAASSTAAMHGPGAGPDRASADRRAWTTASWRRHRASNKPSSAPGTSPGTTPATPNARATARSRSTTQADGSLKGYWSIKNPPVILQGGMAFDNNVWAGRLRAARRQRRFSSKGHFRLETRGGTALTGSYQRDGTAIPTVGAPSDGRTPA